MKALLLGEQTTDLIRVGRVLEDHGWQVEMSDWTMCQLENRAEGACELVVAEVVTVDAQLQTLLEKIRVHCEDTVAMVLGEFSVEERIRALNMGADEFLRREASGALVLGRALALLRLRSERFQASYRIGDLTVDLLQRRVSRCGRELTLSQREFQLLVLLTQHAGRTLSRSDLIEQLWGQGSSADDNALDVHVSRLRRKLDGPFANKLICTVRGVGYRLSTAEALTT